MDVFAKLSPAIQFVDTVTLSTELEFQLPTTATDTIPVTTGTVLGKVSWLAHDDSAGRGMQEVGRMELLGVSSWTSSVSNSRLDFNLFYGGSSGYLARAFSISNNGGGYSGLPYTYTTGSMYAEQEVRAQRISAGSTTEQAVTSGTDLGTIGWFANDSSSGVSSKQHTRFVLRGGGDWTAGQSPASLSLQMWRGGDTGVGGKWVHAWTVNNGDGATGVRVDMSVNGSLAINGDLSCPLLLYSGTSEYTIPDDRMVVVLSGSPAGTSFVNLPPAGMAGVGRFITVIRVDSATSTSSVWAIRPTTGNSLRHRASSLALYSPSVNAAGYIRSATFYQLGMGAWTIVSTCYT